MKQLSVLCVLLGVALATSRQYLYKALPLSFLDHTREVNLKNAEGESTQMLLTDPDVNNDMNNDPEAMRQYYETEGDNMDGEFLYLLESQKNEEQECWECVWFTQFYSRGHQDACFANACDNVPKDYIDALRISLAWPITEDVLDDLLKCYDRREFESDDAQAACFQKYAPKGSEEVWGKFIGYDGRDFSHGF